MARSSPKKHDTHIVLLRRFIDGRADEQRWVGMGFASSLDEAKRLATRPTDQDGVALGLNWGDLLLALPMEQINPLMMREAAKALHIVRQNGTVSRAYRIPRVTFQESGTWLRLWEGENADPSVMLRLSASIDSRRIAAVAVAMARTVIGYARENYPDKTISGMIRALDAVDEYALRNGPESGVASAARSIYQLWAHLPSRGVAAGEAFDAVRDAVSLRPDALSVSSRAGFVAAVQNGTTATQELLGMAHIVQEFIPLSVAILASLGETYPLHPSGLHP